ncbi:uncharacterized protein LOC110616599 [Manihot esculenta]|uniref:uncharacterized protein LOC110616599 n=1 Tax=Manihot esculenta TaxID=3983 RepID=UPI001CC486D3|nr:uncharacterized protein LOC110616599 [Manihot esculenta]
MVRHQSLTRSTPLGLAKCPRTVSILQHSHQIHLLGNFSTEAYCLYKQNKLNKALESLKVQERNSETMLLESQILFCMGKMGACVDVYQKLLKSKIDSLEINHVAGLVLGGRASEVLGMMEANRIKASSSFELAYNTACSLIERNKYIEAEQILLTARR